MTLGGTSAKTFRCTKLSTSIWRNWPEALLAANTYANDPRKPALTVAFALLRAKDPFLEKLFVDVGRRIANLRTVLLTMGCILRQI